MLDIVVAKLDGLSAQSAMKFTFSTCSNAEINIQGKLVDVFLADLKLKSKDYKFLGPKDKMLCDQFTFGTCSFGTCIN